MSTLWTPGGERPIRRDPPGPGGAPPAGAGSPGGAGAAPPGEGQPSEEELRAEMTRLRDELARTPAEVVIANHAFGLFELAALHLSIQPAQLSQARLAIDALAAVVDGLGDRLGDAHPQLSEGLSQLRMAYVQIHRASQAAAGGGGPDGEAGPDAGGPDDGGGPGPAPGSGPSTGSGAG
jgi:hypothetical protein